MPLTGEAIEVHHLLRGGFYCRETRPAAAPSEAPILLWIHGLGESAYCFEEVLAEPRLGRWPQVAPDLVGYGKTPPSPGGPLSLAGHAERLAAWLGDELAGRRLVLAGHSMGGVIATELGERLGAGAGGPVARVAAVVDVEGNVSPDDCTFSARAAAFTAEEWLRGGRRQLLDRAWEIGAGDPSFRRYFASMSLGDPATYHRNAVELVAVSAEETLAARLAALGVPAIYLLGERSTGERSRALLDAAGISWRAIAAAGHWPFLDRHDDFVTELLAFLDGLPGSHARGAA